MQRVHPLKRRPHKKLLYIIVGVLVAAAIVGFGAWKYQRNAGDTGKVVTTSGATVDHTPATKEDNEASNLRKSSSDPSKTLDNGSTVAAVPFAATLNANVNDGNIHVGTMVDGTTKGTCTLTLSQTGQRSIVRSSTVRQNVNYYDCGVFNIATSDLPRDGQWTLTLSVTSDGQKASDSTKINI